MTPKSITPMQAMELVQDYAKKIEPTNVVFAFKRMRLKPIRETIVDLMKVCIAIHDFGLPITTETVSIVYGINRVNVTPRLHALGDKKCLLLKRSDIKKVGHPLEWTIDPIFLRNYK